MPDFFLEGVDTIHSSQYNIARKGGAAPTPAAAAPASPPAAQQSGGGGSGTGEVMQIFNKIKGLVDPDTVKKTNAVFQFDVKGKLISNLKFS